VVASVQIDVAETLSGNGGALGLTKTESDRKRGSGGGSLTASDVDDYCEIGM
jgi:hypothetical protein